MNGYTKGAKESAKKNQIRLLTVKGLSEDRLSKSIYNAIQSIIYILPIYKGYSIISSIQDTSNNEHLMFYNEKKEYMGNIADILYDLWENNKIPLSIGSHNFKVKIPSNWFNLENDKLIICDFPIDIELLCCGYVLSLYGNATHLSLVQDETEEIKKTNINLNFENNKKSSIQLFNSEEELNTFLNSSEEIYKVTTSRLKLPKVRMNGLFYPLSKKVSSEFQNFYNNPNKSEFEVIKFKRKIKEIDQNIFSIFDK